MAVASQKPKHLWYRVVPVDYYGEFEGLYPVGVHPEWPYNKQVHSDLKQNTKIAVKWPDNSITTEKLKFQEGHGTAQIDMNNHPDHFSTRRLYILRDSRGVKVRVYLKGLRVAVLSRKESTNKKVT